MESYIANVVPSFVWGYVLRGAARRISFMNSLIIPVNKGENVFERWGLNNFEKKSGWFRNSQNNHI
jgi:hypothetical protein